jgi:hypothetical protein
MAEYKYNSQSDFQQFPWVADIRAKPGFYNWAITIDPSGAKLLIAAFCAEDNADIFFEKVALVPEEFYRYTPIEWNSVETYLT